MRPPSLTARHRRYLAGGSLSLIGVGLLGVPAYDMWDDVTDLSWSLATTFAENAVFLLLAGTLVAGGIWLVRTDWETDIVVTVAKRTLMGTIAISILMVWAVGLQLWAMHAPKPYVLAADGVLLGSVTSFGLGVSTARTGRIEREAARKELLNDHLEALHEYTKRLEAATSHAAAHEIVGDAVAELATDTPYRVVVDGETVLEGGPRPDAGSALSAVDPIPIDSRGRIELAEDLAEEHERTSLELLGTHLSQTLQRLDREQALRDERDLLEFINRTIRHDLLNDLNLVESRLSLLEERTSLEDEQARDHWSVVTGRVEEMDEFVQRMRTYMESVLEGDHEVEAVALRPVLESELEAVQQAFPDAEIELGAVPDVSVQADELLDDVFRNVFENAVEHNDEPTPRIEVGADRSDDRIRIRVADNGPGIPAERKASIFDRGERAEESPGSGFGLYLVRDVVETYDGTIRIEDNDPKGTVFVLELPLATPKNPA